MRYLILFGIFILFSSCGRENDRVKSFTSVIIEPIVKDSTFSIRALDFNEEYIFYGSGDHIGKYALNSQLKIDINNLSVDNNKNNMRHVFTYGSDTLHFRAIQELNGDFLAISIASPARLYKLNRKSSTPRLVYEELHEKVFYDAMNFWNDKEGIAIGDPVDNCMSIIISRDSGETWHKIPCDILPVANEGEGAFAASDTNIAISGNKTWVATGGKTSRILYSADKGKTWETIEVPIIQGKETTGLYSIDFYNEQIGFGIGGDYTRPNDTLNNKIRTQDGGKTWEVVANGNGPGYRSCVQYIPNSKGEALVAVGYKGVDYSNDNGETWTHLSDEGFYTIRFIDEVTAYAAGRGRIVKLLFK